MTVCQRRNSSLLEYKDSATKIFFEDRTSCVNEEQTVYQGLYNSVLFKALPLYPPITNTVPFVNMEAVC